MFGAPRNLTRSAAAQDNVSTISAFGGAKKWVICVGCMDGPHADLQGV